MAAATSNQVTVSSSAVVIVPAVQTEVRNVVLKNTNATATNTLVIGGSSSVTAGNGHILAGGESVTIRLKAGQDIYGIRGSVDVVASYIAT